jgi:predicted amidohydrolase YtcJ
MHCADLILRNVRPFGGAATDIAISEGRIAAMGFEVPHSGLEVSGEGRDVIPGLVDHHLHLFATAARADSVDLSALRSAADIQVALRKATAGRPATSWVRATGFVEDKTLPDRHILDQWMPDRPLRIQGRTGGLWLLNSMALAAFGPGPWPDCVECDAAGQPTGRIWRGDDWLRQAIGGQPPKLTQISADLARYGITSVTDAGSKNGPQEATLFEAAIARRELVQRLTLMGRENLPASRAYRRSALKLLYDESDLPDIGTVAARIRTARAHGRPVAAHCVTLGELLSFLAALDAAGGAKPGDRIEHGSVIPLSLMADIAAAGLTVVTQPGFVRTRGDRYRATMDADELPDLYRLRSLLDAGIAVLAGSDAPYGDVNPWAAIDAAIHRTTASGLELGKSEALSQRQALSLFLSTNRIIPGMAADLCLLNTPLSELAITGGRNPVALTLVAGQAIFHAETEPPLTIVHLV